MLHEFDVNGSNDSVSRPVDCHRRDTEYEAAYRRQVCIGDRQIETHTHRLMCDAVIN